MTDIADILTSTSDVGTRCRKLAKLVGSVHGSTGYEGLSAQRQFYDKVLDVLEAVFGEGKSAKRPWLELAQGIDWRSYDALPRKQRETVYSKEQRSRAKACLALVNQLLQPKVETKGSFMSLTRVAHRFPFPLGFMPITTRQKVAAGVPNSSPLLRLLRDRSARRGTARLTIKPADKHVMVDLFELLVLFMVHYPVSAKRAKRASASSTSRADSGGQYYGAPGMGGGRFGDALSLVAPSFLNRKKLPPTLLYTDVQRQKLRSPYLTLVWHYLYHFLMPPEETPSSQFALQRGAGSMFNMSSGAAMSTVSPDGMLLLYAFREFWLSQNPPEVLLQSENVVQQPKGSPTSMMQKRLTQRGGMESFQNFSVDYIQPTRELLQCVLFLTTHLLADPNLETSLSPYSENAPGSRLTEPLVELLWSLFKFFNVNLACCPLLSQPNVFPDVVDVWLAYLTPWRADHRSTGRVPLDPARRALKKAQRSLIKDGVSTFKTGMSLVTAGVYQDSSLGPEDDDDGADTDGKAGGKKRAPRRIDPSQGDFANRFYKPKAYKEAWEQYVVHNYLFYVQLLAQFVRRANSLDYVSGRKYDNLRMLERVLVVFEPCVLATLKKCSDIIERATSNKFKTPNTRVAGQGWILPALQQHVAAVLGPNVVPPTLATFQRDAADLMYTLSEADVNQDAEKRRLQAEWRNEPVLDRAAAWMWSWLPGTGHGTRAYIAQNDKVIAEFRKRLQACMAKVKTVFGVTKARRAKPMPDALSASAEHIRALAPDTLHGPQLRGFLSPAGRWQLQHGLRKTNALEVAHIGAGAHMRPCGTYEVRLVLRLLVRLSHAWDKYRGLDHELSDGGDGIGGASRHSLRARMLMSRPSPTLERVRVFADVRVMLLLPVTLWCAFHLLRFLLYALYIILSAMFSVPNTPAAGQYRRPATGARLSSAYGRNL